MQIVYETMYILRPDLGEEQVNLAIAKYQSILSDNGAHDIEIQHRGRRRLAQDIGKHREGIYVQMNYQCNGSQIAPMERAMRLSEEVIRYLTIKQEVREPKPEPVETESVS
jgi:small subunit ribosomal protein S6